MTTRALAKYTTVIVRLDRTIRYAAADVRLTTSVITSYRASAGHDEKE